MVRVEDVARDVLAAVASQAGFLLAAKWVSGRYQQLCGTRRLRHLRRLGELVIPADVTTGTVTTTRGAQVVTGSAAAQTAWAAIAADLNAGLWYVRQATVWYRVVAFVGGALQLAVAFAEDSATDSGYRLVPRRRRVAADAKTLGAFVHTRRKRALDIMDQAVLDQRDPGRVRVGTAGPTVWSESERADDGALVIETYPSVAESELLRYTYYLYPPELTLRDPLPPAFESIWLREGAMIDAMRFEMARAARAGQNDAAALWRNEYRAQETRWEAIQRDAAGADLGGDDVALIFDTMRGAATPTEIRDAHDEVWSRY
jgi:hypothetical protein